MTIVKCVDHVSIAVHSIDEAERLLVDILGAQPHEPKTRSDTGEFYWADYLLAGFKIELVQPVDPEQGDIARFLQKRGEGLHHLSLEVNDIHKAIAHFEAKDCRVVQKQVDVDEGWRDAFLSPRTSHGVLIQIWDAVGRHHA